MLNKLDLLSAALVTGGEGKEHTLKLFLSVGKMAIWRYEYIFKSVTLNA
jgi:hypothetical protein